MQENVSGMLMLPLCDHPVQTECTISLWLWRLIPPILLFLGTCGNILNLAVLFRKKIRAHSTTIYLLFMAVSDLTILWCMVMRNFMLRSMGIDIKNLSIFNCVVHEWLSYTMGGFSVWMVVLLTIERTLFTVWPVYAREKVTRKKTILAIITLFGILVLFTGHLLFTYGLRMVPNESQYQNGTNTMVTYKTVCTARTEELGNFVKGRWRVLVLIFLNIIPLTLVIIGNTVIALTLLVQKRNRQLRVHPETQRSTILDEKRHSAARMLFFISSFLLITTVPFGTFGVVKSTMFSNVQDRKVYARLQLANAFVNILLYFNYTFNFLLYFVSGCLFKQEWKKLISEAKYKFTRALSCLSRS